MHLIYECPESFRDSLAGYTYGYFSQIVLIAFVPIDSMNVHRKFEMRIALAIPEIIVIGVLVWVVNLI